MLDNYITQGTILSNWSDESIPTTQKPLSVVYSFGAIRAVTLFNPVQQLTDSCLVKGHLTLGHLAFMALLKP